MDDDTILIAFGDHGMTNDGTHGGDTENEIRTAIFAYHKSGFPFLENTTL